jgi:hypothetical protein
MELAEQKSTAFPSLKAVTLEEVCRRQKEWLYPEAVLDAFGTGGIHLLVEGYFRGRQ